MVDNELKTILDEANLKYEQPHFIDNDPISIPHEFSTKEDIEASAFLTSIISWGKRSEILKNAHLLMQILQHSPYDFVCNASKNELEKLKTFYYRTLNGSDMFEIVLALKEVYKKGSIEDMFVAQYEGESFIDRMARFYGFLRKNLSERAKKHVSSMDAGSAGKRANMFLRWMVRSNAKGVDFGIWKAVLSSELFLPIDVHVANIARRFNLTKRKANDRKTVEEVTSILREFCPEDPVKYDFALFSLDMDKS